MVRHPIQYLHMEMREDNIPGVVEVAVKLLRPQWDAGKVVHKRNYEGFVNITVIVSRDGEDMSDALVLRTVSEIFGAPVADQHHACKFLHENDLGPVMLAFLDNGICMEFVKGVVLKWKDWVRLHEPNVWKPVAKSLAKWHQKKLYEKAIEEGVIEAGSLLWGNIVPLKWDKLLAVPEMEPYLGLIPNREDLLSGEKEVISRLIEQGDLDKRVCHLDVNVSNIAYDEASGTTTLIDFDYTSISYIQMDISWYFHICQDIDRASLDEYPSEEYRKAFITEYLQQRNAMDGLQEPEEADVKRLMVQVEKTRLINLLRSVVDGPAMLYTTRNNPDRMDFDGFVPLAAAAWKKFSKEKEETLAMKSH